MHMCARARARTCENELPGEVIHCSAETNACARARVRMHAFTTRGRAFERDPLAREENNRDVRTGEGGKSVGDVGRLYARVPWRASRRVIWTVPAVGCQNQTEREEGIEVVDTSIAKIRGSMNLMIYKWTELGLI